MTLRPTTSEIDRRLRSSSKNPGGKLMTTVLGLSALASRLFDGDRLMQLAGVGLIDFDHVTIFYGNKLCPQGYRWRLPEPYEKECCNDNNGSDHDPK